MTITSSVGERTFYDDFCAYLAVPGRTYISNIDGVWTAMSAVAQ